MATHSIRQFPLQFPSRASPCAITFQLESTIRLKHRSQFIAPLCIPGGSPCLPFLNVHEVLNWPPTVCFYLYSHELRNRTHCSFCKTGGLVCQRSASKSNRPNYDMLHCSPVPTGHLDTGFSWFPCIYKQMLRWFPKFQVATTCFSCSPPDLNLVVTNFMFCI